MVGLEPRAWPRDRCPYSRDFDRDSPRCPAYQAVQFLPADSTNRPLTLKTTCHHLGAGAFPGDPGRFYPRCSLGGRTERLAWVQDVGGERLAVLRELQLELDTELLPYRSRLAEAHAKQPPAWLRPRAGVEDEELGALSTAARAFLARHRDRLTAAGLDLEPLLELHEAVVGRGQVEPPPEGPDMEADRMAIVEQRGRAGIAVAGEIDVATVPQLEQALSTRVDTAAEFHVDFSGVDFCDLRGLAAIIRVGRRLRRGRRLIVHGLPEALRRAMVIAGWDPQTMPWLVLTPEVTT